MESLPNGFQLEIPGGCFPLSTDSMVLSDFCRLPRNARVLDLGSGCGTLGLLLCAGNRFCTVMGVEADPAAHMAALENISRNRLENRMESLCRDLKTVPTFLAAGSFSCCISNPPYFAGGPDSASLPDARKERSCNVKDLFRAAAWALKFGGDFFLVQKPERLGELLGEGSKQGFECKRLGLLRHRTGGPVILVLLQMRKGGKPGLKLEELSLYNSDGSPTEDLRRIYHMEDA